MKSRNYLILCGAITVVLVVSLLYIPGVSDAVEWVVLGFLSSSA